MGSRNLKTRSILKQRPSALASGFVFLSFFQQFDFFFRANRRMLWWGPLVKPELEPTTKTIKEPWNKISLLLFKQFFLSLQESIMITFRVGMGQGLLSFEPTFVMAIKLKALVDCSWLFLAHEASS